VKFFIDTANTKEIREAASLGVLDGVTTNPSLIAKEGREFHEVLREIVSIVNGPIWTNAMSRWDGRRWRPIESPGTGPSERGRATMAWDEIRNVLVLAGGQQLLEIRDCWEWAGNWQIVPVPRNSELWYDDRDIPFLQEDLKDAAEIQNKRAQTIRTLTDAGFTAETVISAVDNDDMSLLAHSGLFSVQLQPPGTIPTQEPTDD